MRTAFESRAKTVQTDFKMAGNEQMSKRLTIEWVSSWVRVDKHAQMK
jgi:hypothetical protein